MEGRYDDNGDFFCRLFCPQGIEDGGACPSRHPNIEEDQVGMLFIRCLNSSDPLISLDRFIPLHLEPIFDNTDEVTIVIGYQYFVFLMYLNPQRDLMTRRRKRVK